MIFAPYRWRRVSQDACRKGRHRLSLGYEVRGGQLPARQGHNQDLVRRGEVLLNAGRDHGGRGFATGRTAFRFSQIKRPAATLLDYHAGGVPRAHA
jgi:hypothetical protein